MSILLFVNLKGGVAKTTNAVAIAECLADSGYRTLLIDADHQCMSSELLLGESRMLKCEKKEITLHDLLAAMLDNEFKPEQMPYYAVKNVSDIGGGVAEPLRYPLLNEDRRLLDEHGESPAWTQVE